jgi:adenosine deaminase CECR1
VKRQLAQPDVLATDVTVRFQESVARFFPNSEDRVTKAYDCVAAHRDLWVAVNLVGIEENGRGYPLRFLETFRALRVRHPTLPL